MTRLKKSQKLFLNYAFGGPTKWNGKSIRAAHSKMDLTEVHFNAVAENLQASLKELKVADDLIA
jgi:hemoglobin